MARTTLVSEFLRAVCTELVDISPQYKRWPEKELVQRINYGQMAIAKYLPQAGARVDAVRLQPGTRQDFTKVLATNIIPGDGSTAADTYGISFMEMIRNMGADGLTPGRSTRPGSRETLDNLETTTTGWHTETAATSVLNFMAQARTPNVVYVTPPVHASTPVWVEVSWMAEPQRVPAGGDPGAEIYAYAGGSTTLLGINDQFVDDLHAYVMAAALMKGSKNTSNQPKAEAYVRRFADSIAAQVTVLGGVSPRLKTLPFINQLQEEADG